MATNRLLFNRQDPENITELSLDGIEHFIQCLITSTSTGSDKYIAKIIKSFEKNQDLKNDKIVCELFRHIFDEILYLDDDSSKNSAKKLLVLFFNEVIKKISKATLQNVVKQLDIYYVFRLMDFLEITGNFHVQITLVQSMFQTYGFNYLKEKASDLLAGNGQDINVLRELFCSITRESFFESTRAFLNVLNKRTSKVFSIKANSIEIDEYKYIHKNKNKKFWVDINQVDVELSWYFPKSEISKLLMNSNLFSDDQLVLVTVNLENVLNTDVLGFKTKEYCIIFKLNGPIKVNSLDIQIKNKTKIKIKFPGDEKFHLCVDNVLSGLLHKNPENTIEPTIRKISAAVTKSKCSNYNESSCLNSYGLKPSEYSLQSNILTIDMSDGNSISPEYETALMCDSHKVSTFQPKDFKELPITVSPKNYSSHLIARKEISTLNSIDKESLIEEYGPKFKRSTGVKKDNTKDLKKIDKESVKEEFSLKFKRSTGVEKHNTNDSKKVIDKESLIEENGLKFKRSTGVEKHNTNNSKQTKKSTAIINEFSYVKSNKKISKCSQISMIANENCSFDRDIKSSIESTISIVELTLSPIKDLFSSAQPYNDKELIKVNEDDNASYGFNKEILDISNKNVIAGSNYFNVLKPSRSNKNLDMEEIKILPNIKTDLLDKLDLASNKLDSLENTLSSLKSNKQSPLMPIKILQNIVIKKSSKENKRGDKSLPVTKDVSKSVEDKSVQKQSIQEKIMPIIKLISIENTEATLNESKKGKKRKLTKNNNDQQMNKQIKKTQSTKPLKELQDFQKYHLKDDKMCEAIREKTFDSSEKIDICINNLQDSQVQNKETHNAESRKKIKQSKPNKPEIRKQFNSEVVEKIKDYQEKRQSFSDEEDIPLVQLQRIKQNQVLSLSKEVTHSVQVQRELTEEQIAKLKTEELFNLEVVDMCVVTKAQSTKSFQKLKDLQKDDTKNYEMIEATQEKTFDSSAKIDICINHVQDAQVKNKETCNSRKKIKPSKSKTGKSLNSEVVGKSDDRVYQEKRQYFSDEDDMPLAQLQRIKQNQVLSLSKEVINPGQVQYEQTEEQIAKPKTGKPFNSEVVDKSEVQLNQEKKQIFLDEEDLPLSQKIKQNQVLNLSKEVTHPGQVQQELSEKNLANNEATELVKKTKKAFMTFGQKKLLDNDKLTKNKHKPKITKEAQTATKPDLPFVSYLGPNSEDDEYEINNNEDMNQQTCFKKVKQSNLFNSYYTTRDDNQSDPFDEVSKLPNFVATVDHKNEEQNFTSYEPAYSIKSTKSQKRLLYDGEEITHLDELKMEISKMDLKRNKVSKKNKILDKSKTIRKKKRKHLLIQSIPSDFESAPEDNMGYENFLELFLNVKTVKVNNNNQENDTSDEEVSADINNLCTHIIKKSKMILKETKNLEDKTFLKYIQKYTEKFFKKRKYI